MPSPPWADRECDPAPKCPFMSLPWHEGLTAGVLGRLLWTGYRGGSTVAITAAHGYIRSMPEIFDRFRQRAFRARTYAGYERDVAVLLLKSAVAGVTAWAIAQYAIASPQPTYAPFVALLVVQSTVYRSLLHSVQYVGAVLLGVLAAGATSPLLGDNVGAFAVMLVVGVLVGHWRRLGTMGVQAPIAGIFAYNALLGAPETSMLWSIVSMVLLGAGIGLAVNLLLLPPMRYATADRGVQQLSTGVAELLRDMAEGLRAGIPEPGTAGDWRRRSRELDSTVSKARSAVEHSAESISYNPRRMFRKHRPVAGFDGYRMMVETLARATEQLRNIAFGLRKLLHDETGHTADGTFFRPYAEILAYLADGVQHLGSTTQGAGRRLRGTADTCYELCERLEAHVREKNAWPALGGLLTDASRLVEELSEAHARGAVRAD